MQLKRVTPSWKQSHWGMGHKQSELSYPEKQCSWWKGNVLTYLMALKFCLALFKSWCHSVLLIFHFSSDSLGSAQGNSWKILCHLLILGVTLGWLLGFSPARSTEGFWIFLNIFLSPWIFLFPLFCIYKVLWGQRVGAYAAFPLGASPRVATRV